MSIERLQAELEAERRHSGARGEEYADSFDVGIAWDVGAPLIAGGRA